MGLDMHLTAKKYIGGSHEFKGVHGMIAVNERPHDYSQEKEEWIPREGAEVRNVFTMTDLSRLSEITLHVGYWRKANAVHKWFVENCQGGVDECQESCVEREQLEELKDLCERAITAIEKCPKKTVERVVGWQNGKDMKENFDVYDVPEEVIRALLPTESGFFFGSTAYDEWYIQDLKDTIEIINTALTDPLFEDCDFYYRASW